MNNVEKEDYFFTLLNKIPELENKYGYTLNENFICEIRLFVSTTNRVDIDIVGRKEKAIDLTRINIKNYEDDRYPDFNLGFFRNLREENQNRIIDILESIIITRS